MAAGTDLVANLAAVGYAPPRFRIGQRVWYGGRSGGSGWRVVAGLTISPARFRAEDGGPPEYAATAAWWYDLVFADGTHWGDATEDDLADGPPV